MKSSNVKKEYISGRKVLTLLSFPILLSAWTTPINISNTDSLSALPAMAMDKRGWLHCVWMERDLESDFHDIYYTYYNGSTWSIPINVSNDSLANAWPDVAVDTLNRVHIIWGVVDSVMWTMWNGDTWTTPISISPPGYACDVAKIAVNPLNNYVHCVMYNTGACDIWHTFFNGDTWSIPKNVTNDTDDSAYPDIAIDSRGRIHLVWMNYAAGGVMDSIEIYYSCFDSVSWTSPVNISRTVGGSGDPRIAIDRYNNPRVVWEERDAAGCEVYYTYFNGAAWVNPVLVSTNPSYIPDIAIDKDNRVHIVWSGGTDIFYAVYDDTMREFPPENASNTDSGSTSPNVVVDTQFVHLVWSDRSKGAPSNINNAEIYYSRRELSGIREKEQRKTSISIPPIAIRKLFFTFSLSQPSTVDISFYDLAGRKVKEVSLGVKEKGAHQSRVLLNLPTGIYFLILKAGPQNYRGKFILINP